MAILSVNSTCGCGKVKPMHAVNNGPVYKFAADQRITNIDAFRDAGIPYARTHDASFYSTYGGEHTVDILAVFPDFAADAEDPASYDFCLTDEYMKVIYAAGTEPYYRLGSKIEHWPKKYGTRVPGDFHKWAVIAEHIIAHYTEGWADGFHYDMKYWEIWNEPDLDPDDAPPEKKRCWSGTAAQFYEFFDVVAKHLKARFPERKIGGPAASYSIKPWVKNFLAYLKEHGTPLDFFSWHMYAASPAQLLAVEKQTRQMLDDAGFPQTESILNEWNYVRGWTGDDWLYSLRSEKGLKGSSFIAGVIAGSQYRPLDMLMFYDARPCAMNSMFCTDFVCDKLKGYYPFLYFGELYRLGTAVEVTSDDKEIYAAAAKSADALSVMMTYYLDADEAEDKDVRVDLDLTALPGAPYEVTYTLLDKPHDADVVLTQTVDAARVSLHLTLSLFSTVLISVKKA